MERNIDLVPDTATIDGDAGRILLRKFALYVCVHLNSLKGPPDCMIPERGPRSRKFQKTGKYIGLPA